MNYLNGDTGLEIRGIGSISSVLDFRGLGYGSELIRKTIEYINRNTSIDIWFLYSDISVNIYKKLKFEELANNTKDTHRQF